MKQTILITKLFSSGENMKKLIIASIFVFTSLYIYTTLNGCGDESVVNPVYTITTNGAYILSEGTNPSNSRLSFYSVPKDSFYQSIYNGNLAYPDGLEIFNGDLYLVEQGPTFAGPGKVYLLDSNGGLKISSNPFGSSPYSIVLTGQRAYITNGPGSKVTVLEMHNLAFIQDINVGVYPQELAISRGKIFVCNTSAFGGNADSTVSVIDPNSNTVIQTIVLRKDPSSIKSIQVQGGNELYIGCQGGGGIIYKINPETNNKLDSFSLPNGFDRDLVIYKGAIYFISGSNNIDKLDLSTRIVSTFITNPGVPSFFYGYNIDVINGKHYVLDAKNFSVDGNLFIYNTSGSIEKTFSTGGVAPRRVVFKTQTTSSGL